MKKKNKETAPLTISRRNAIKKAGIYAAYTAAASLILLNPRQAQADSPVDPGWGN